MGGGGRKRELGDRDTLKRFHLLIAAHNAGVKRPASAGPLEQLVIRAIDFDRELLF